LALYQRGHRPRELHRPDSPPAPRLAGSARCRGHGRAPGTLRRLDPASISAGSFGTHAGSIGQLATYLADCANQIVILGIQPAYTTPGTRLSPPVRATLKALAHSLAQNCVP